MKQRSTLPNSAQSQLVVKRDKKFGGEQEHSQKKKKMVFAGLGLDECEIRQKKRGTSLFGNQREGIWVEVKMMSLGLGKSFGSLPGAINRSAAYCISLSCGRTS